MAPSTEQLLTAIGEQLRTKRISKNLTQSEVAGKAGLSRRTVQAIERGKSISLDHFISILRVLDSLDILVAYADRKEISPLMIAQFKGSARQRASKVKLRTREDEYQW